MDFEWDEAKRRANILKHGIDFVDAIEIFAGHFEESEDRRRDYGETRILATGESQGRILRVVYTPRSGRRRTINARRARRNERRAYYASHPRAGEENEK